MRHNISDTVESTTSDASVKSPRPLGLADTAGVPKAYPLEDQVATQARLEKPRPRTVPRRGLSSLLLDVRFCALVVLLLGWAWAFVDTQRIYI